MDPLLEIVINEPFQAELIKHLYTDKLDLHLAYPDAKYPFCSDQWHHLVTKNTENTSLVFKLNQNIVGHSALICNGELLYLCFVIIQTEYRKQKLAKEMIGQCEEFCRLNYQHQDLWLNVNKKNTNAIGLYKGIGYEIETEIRDKITMKKRIKA